MSDLVVTLSSVPPRLPHLGPTLESLLAQTARASEIRLYVPRRYRRFPDWDGTLPALPAGVRLCRTEEDFGPATKILPAVRDLAGADVEILFCDDDNVYPPGLAARLLAERARVPGACIAVSGYEATRIGPATMQGRPLPRAVRRWRKTDLGYQLRRAAHRLRRRLTRDGWRPLPSRATVRRAGYVDIFEGTGGVLVRPGFFDPAAFDMPPVMWSVDDVWLSGMAAKAGHPVWLIAGWVDAVAQPAVLHGSLHHAVIEGADRTAANRACLEHLQAEHGLFL